MQLALSPQPSKHCISIPTTTHSKWKGLTLGIWQCNKARKGSRGSISTPLAASYRSWPLRGSKCLHIGPIYRFDLSNCRGLAIVAHVLHVWSLLRVLASSRSHEVKVAWRASGQVLSLLDTVFSVMFLLMSVGGLNLQIRSGHEPCSCCMHGNNARCCRDHCQGPSMQYTDALLTTA